eukprot:6213952-Pleurochrysis_carterae.AAC.4
MRSSKEQLLRHTNARYGVAGRLGARRVARGPDSHHNTAKKLRVGGGRPAWTSSLHALFFKMFDFIRASAVMTANMCCLAKKSAKCKGGRGCDC